MIGLSVFSEGIRTQDHVLEPHLKGLATRPHPDGMEIQLATAAANSHVAVARNSQAGKVKMIGFDRK